MERIRKRHPVFFKYRREWLADQTGYSKEYLRRMANGSAPLSLQFVHLVSNKLGQPKEALFLLKDREPFAESHLSRWLLDVCRRRHLSLRRAAARSDLSHATISEIIRGKRPSATTILKLAEGFGGDGERGLALADRLLVFAGYRVDRTGEDYLKIIPLLSPEYQRIIEFLVRKFAEIEDIKP